MLSTRCSDTGKKDLNFRCVFFLNFFLCVLLFGCSTTTLKKNEGKLQNQVFQIKNLSVNEFPGKTEVVIEGEGPLFYQVIKVPESNQFIVEVPDVILGNHVSPIVVQQGPVVDVYPRELDGLGAGVQFEINHLPHASTRISNTKERILVEISGSLSGKAKISESNEKWEKKLVSLEKPIKRAINDITISEEEKVYHSPKDYVIGPEDQLEILVWKNEVLSRTVSVRPDGKISFPLIGDLGAIGLTPLQLRNQIAFRLKEFMENPTVTVIVSEINSYVVYIMGEVIRAGKFQLKTNTTLLQALTLAGGFTPFAAKNKIVVFRREYGKTTETKIKIKYNDIVSGDHKGNIILKPGDTIIVP